MPALRSTKKRINLLPKGTGDDTRYEKAVNWALSVGRWVVVLTEFVVVCAFMSRFYFDTKLDNLFEDLRQKKAIVNSVGSFETNYKELQNRTTLVKTLIKEANAVTPAMATITGSIPEGIFLTMYLADSESITLNGKTDNEGKINYLAQTLIKSNQFAEVSIGSISKDIENPSISKFTMKIGIKKKQ